MLIFYLYTIVYVLMRTFLWYLNIIYYIFSYLRGRLWRQVFEENNTFAVGYVVDEEQ